MSHAKRVSRIEMHSSRSGFCIETLLIISEISTAELEPGKFNLPILLFCFPFMV